MPGEHCSVCGIIRTAKGCACNQSEAIDPQWTHLLFQSPVPETAEAAEPATTMPAPQPSTLTPPATPAVDPGSDEGADPLRRRRMVRAVAGVGVAVLLCAGLAYAVAPDGGATEPALAVPSGTLGLGDAPAASTQPITARSALAGSPASARPSLGANGSAHPANGPTTATADTPAGVPSGPVPPVFPQPSGSRPGSHAPSATPSGPPALRLGDSGPEVLTMQKELVTVSCGKVDKSLETGTFDAKTQSALQDFQHANKLQNQEDGWYGPATRAVLEPRAQNPDCPSSASPSPQPSAS